ncbi:hypothetical protein HZP84_03960 [Elizabethkingia anophelis]|uniref:hypothetical protein n=1 Tax=Elizabethkingia meningoseptica TaxID=238 RepID=UPI0018C281BD|nr:hypothetical protein [Elizabethkingia meningoseptica]MBG0515326.1 hypothetical protein [Elizabethkingia meningoseptica]MCT4079284.1 hypothetical protein [Elizabethkingia anophelis]
MAKTITATAIANEIVRYGDRSALDLKPAILSEEILLNKYAKPLPKVKGKWSFPSVFMGNVVQVFSDTWTEYGQIQFANKVAKNFHQKVNFPIKPYEIYGSWEERLYEEDKQPKDMPISKFIVGEIASHITSDLANISITGVYDPAQIGSNTPEYTKSMDGLNKTLDDMEADATNPVFHIPVDAALLADQPKRVDAFEEGFPQGAKVSTIFMPLAEWQAYVKQRENLQNQPIDYKAGYRTTSRYGRDLVGVPGMKPGRLVAWIDGNLFRLYDRKDNPAAIDDVQVFDYKVKIFIQWHLGYDFAVNQGVFVETANAAKKRGLNNATQNKMYFPNEFGLTV